MTRERCGVCGRRVELVQDVQTISGVRWAHLLTVAGIEAERDHQGKPARSDFRVVLRPSGGGSHIYPEQILADGLTRKEAEAHATRSRRNYLYPNTVEVR